MVLGGLFSFLSLRLRRVTFANSGKGTFRAVARVTFGPDEIFLSFASGGLLSFPGERGTFRAPARGAFLFYASGGLFSFSSERKEEKKRRQKLRFWISLRGFT